MRTHRGSAALLLATVMLTMGLPGCAPAPPASDVAPAPAGVQATQDRFAGAPQGTATVEGAVQRISIDVSQGFYDPTIVNVKAGVPVEIAFGQGQGCLARVQFPGSGIDQDLTQGGATVTLPAMRPGEYEFHCGMSMVYGKIVAR